MLKEMVSDCFGSALLGDDGVQQQTATKNPKPTTTCLDFACVVPAVCSERYLISVTEITTLVLFFCLF